MLQAGELALSDTAYMPWCEFSFLCKLGPVRNPSFKAALGALASSIRRRRLDIGLSQEDVAHATGLSVRHYQKIESARANSTVRTLLLIARALNISLRDLF